MRSSGILAAAIVALCSASAFAQTRLPVQPTVAPGAHTHDGFYFRFATGLAGYGESIRLDGASESSEVAGLSSVSEIAIGGTLGGGLVLGAGVWTSSVITSERSYRGQTPPGEVMGGSGNYTIVGPFIDWYLDPARGLHFQGAVGISTVRGYNFVEADLYEDAVSVGGGMMLGIGYDLWVADDWSFGLLTRLCVVVAAQRDETNRWWWHGIGSSPSLLFTVTYH